MATAPTVIAVDQIADGESAGIHTIITDITTIVTRGAPWARARIVLMLETGNATGVYEVVPDWEIRSPGSMNVISNAAANLRLKFLVLGITDDFPAKININAN